jgi:hypothetical protein
MLPTYLKSFIDVKLLTVEDKISSIKNLVSGERRTMIYRSFIEKKLKIFVVSPYSRAGGRQCLAAGKIEGTVPR